MHVINYIILAHKNPAQARRLFDNLTDEKTSFYIHVDLNADITQFIKAFESTRVKFIEDRVACSWGDMSIVYATLNCMRDILLDNKHGHTILLSAQDFPLRNKREIYSFFSNRPQANFIECKPIKEAWPYHFKYRTHAYKYNFSSRKGDYASILPILSFRPKGIMRNAIKVIKKGLSERNTKHFKALKFLFINKRPLHGFDIYGGSQWWALTNSMARKIIFQLDNNPEIFRYFRNSVIPDEVFFQTMIMRIKEDEPQIELYKSQTYSRWKSQFSDSPDTLTRSDYEELMSASKNYCFARKFDMHEDQEIILLIEKTINRA